MSDTHYFDIMEVVKALKKLGDAAFEQGSYQEAIESYNLAFEKISADDQKVTVSALLSNRCLCYLKMHKVHEASQDAHKCLLLRPRWAIAHLRVAAIEELQGEFKKAIASYTRAAELDPGLSEEVLQPIKRLQANLAEKHCCAIFLPPPSTATPIYYASTSPKPIHLGPQTGTINSSSHILAAAYGDGAIRLWCTNTGALLQTLKKVQEVDVEMNDHPQASAITTLAWNHDGAILASGSLDMTCTIWKLDGNLKKFKLDSVLKGHSGRISAVRFAPSPTTICEPTTYCIITASTDLSIKVWKIDFSAASLPGHRDDSDEAASACECLCTLDGHSSLVSGIDIDPISGKVLVSASGDAQFKLWDVENSGRLLENVAWESGPVVLCGFLPPNLPYLLTAHAQLARQEGRILLWDVVEKKDGWVDGRLAAPAWSLDGFIGRPTSWDACAVNVQEDGYEGESSVVLAVACSDGTVQVWEILDGNTRPLELFGFEIKKYSGSGSNANSNELPAWHAAALSQQVTPENSFKIKFSPHGHLLAATGGDANQNIYVWSIERGEEFCYFAGHSGRIRSLEWSMDGSYLFSASEDGSVRKWRVETI